MVVTGSYDRTIRVWDLRSNNRDPIQVSAHHISFIDGISPRLRRTGPHVIL